MPQMKQIVLRDLPRGKLERDHFELVTAEQPQPGDGEILVRSILFSLDAANRAWMQGATYREAVKAGDVMHTYLIGEVAASNDPRFKPGDIVQGEGRWAEYVVMDAGKAAPVSDHRPLTHHLSVIGIAGKTAHHGLMQIGEPEPGETLAVSAAAGSVGTLVGQIGKAKGLRVVGIAGGQEKCDWLVNELGFDAAVDYRAPDFFKAMRAACPDGIDIYFDNVGGDVTEAALFLMNLYGRIVCCGAVSQYDTDKPKSPRGLPGLIVVKRLKMQGFIVMDFAAHDAEAEADLLDLAAKGKLKVIEDVIDGIENAPAALIGLLAGENRGKRMVRVAPDP